MRKTPAYIIERYAGYIVGVICGILVYREWDIDSIFCQATYYDKIITISTTIFGFLLTVLTIIVQSSGDTVNEMRKHKSYGRLINYNKKVVFLSGLICLFSVYLFFLVDKMSKSPDLSNIGFTQLLVAVHAGVLVTLLFDTFIFVLIFYLIIKRDNQ